MNCVIADVKDGSLPLECPQCGSRCSVHAGHGHPIRRHGWVSYACGSYWHPAYGWSHSDPDCERRVYAKALHAIARPDGGSPVAALRRVRKIAREALGSAWDQRPTRGWYPKEKLAKRRPGSELQDSRRR